MQETFLFLMLLLGVASPFIALYAISFARKKDFKRHKKIQTFLFWAMTLMVVLFELNMLISKDGRFLPENNPSVQTPFFRILLIAHIIGAVLTFLTWSSVLFISTKKFKSSFNGSFPKMHRAFGYITVCGLFYIAITATAISTIAFIL